MSVELAKMLEDNGVTIITPLTMVEERLLHALAAAPNQIVSKSRIESAIYGDGMQPASNCVEVFVGRLRRKLSDPSVVRTTRGHGYMLATVAKPVPVADTTPTDAVANEEAVA